ncbi:MAG TPA: serine O-acetyltransferase [Candidatus Omnitrophica bacterium]|nr:serine O-acetyltransferase [Candidatus Omnitrophota bacterium]HBG62672.1 serine O-acetyltransferase [Candidatus Omnitrophota bacterium]HCD38915.1 serine O-acetyltransferase [Candidatus Omnitrophota bacterium]
MLLYLLSVLTIAIVLYSFFVALFFREEIQAAMTKDPAGRSYVEVLTLYPGLHSIVMHRLAHALRALPIPFLPRFLSQMMRFFTGIEIHPGAKIGRGLFIDHGMGVVIGETAVVGDNVLLYQGVTLGGTGKEKGKRHPTIGNNVVIGAGAQVLGNIVIGDNSYIGANAVVVKPIPPHSTVVGVPGRITQQDGRKIDFDLDHVHIVDPIMQTIEALEKRIEALEKIIKKPEKSAKGEGRMTRDE